MIYLYVLCVIAPFHLSTQRHKSQRSNLTMSSSFSQPTAAEILQGKPVFGRPKREPTNVVESRFRRELIAQAGYAQWKFQRHGEQSGGGEKFEIAPGHGRASISVVCE